MNSKTIIEVVLAAAILLFMIPVIESQVGYPEHMRGNPPLGTDLEYGEYAEVSGLSSASGSIEVVTYNGKTYIHAISIGLGEAVINGVAVPYNVSKSELYVFVLAGQSQAAYRSVDITVANQNARVYGGQAWYFGTSDQPIYYSSDWTDIDFDSDMGIYSMNNPDGTWRIGSLEAPIASTFVNTTGKNILIVNVAISGRTITSFIGNEEGERYVSKILDTMDSKLSSELYEVHGAGVFWLHGQANLLSSPAWYVQKFGQVYNQYLQRGYNTWIIEQPRSSEAPSIDQANLIICKTYKGCYIGSTFGTTHIFNGGPYLYDGTHYNQLGRNIVGKELAESYLRYGDHSLGWISVESPVLTLAQTIPLIMILGFFSMIGYAIYRRS